MFHTGAIFDTVAQYLTQGHIFHIGTDYLTQWHNTSHRETMFDTVAQYFTHDCLTLFSLRKGLPNEYVLEEVIFCTMN